MRRIWLNRDDFEMFHQDISPLDYEFFRTHVDTFKRMWREQTKRFWSLFLNTFEHFTRKHGCVKDYPMKSREMSRYMDEICEYIKEQFVNGKVSTAKRLMYDCVIVTQNRHCITILDKAAYAQNPFYMKETREVFRQLFGAPNDKKTYMKVICGLPMYVKFAGSVVIALRRWMDAPEINPEDESAKRNYFENIFVSHRDIELSGLALKGTLLRERLGPQIDGMNAEQITMLIYNMIKETPEAEVHVRKPKKKKKKCKSVDENEDPDQVTDVSAQSGKTKASVSTKGGPCKPLMAEAASGKSGELLETKASEKTDSLDDSSTQRVKNAHSVRDKDKTDSLDYSADTAKQRSVKSGSDSSITMETADVSKKDGKKNDGGVKVKEEKFSETKLLLLNEPEVKVQSRRKGQSADTAVGCTDGVDTSSVSDSTPQDSPKAIKNGGGRGGGEQSVVDESGDSSARRKLHTCALCAREEMTAKTFKRCQKCRGKSNPKYYCSRECQLRDWKTHKLDHKDEP